MIKINSISLIRAIYFLIIPLTLFGCGRSSSVCDGQLGDGLYACKMMFGDETRYYQFRVPQSYTGEAVPLVIDLHGAGSPRIGNLSGERLVSGAEAKAEEEGFVVVWPEGVNYLWNLTFPDELKDYERDDVGYVLAIVEKMKTVVNIDESRIYVMGISMGGALTQLLVCERSDVFAAAASVAMQIPNQARDCAMEKPVPFMALHAPTDILVPWHGSLIGGLSAPESYDVWSQMNGCVDEPVAFFSRGESSCVRRSDCSDGVEVSFCNIDGRGYFLGGHLLYFNNGNVNLMDLIWEHFEKFERG